MAVHLLVVMDEEKDFNESRAVFTLLGSLSSDVKHILNAIAATKTEATELRKEIAEEHAKINTRLDRFGARLDRVEQFNLRVITYAGVAAVLILPFINWGVPYLIRKLLGE